MLSANEVRDIARIVVVVVVVVVVKFLDSEQEEVEGEEDEDAFVVEGGGDAEGARPAAGDRDEGDESQSSKKRRP